VFLGTPTSHRGGGKNKGGTGSWEEQKKNIGRKRKEKPGDDNIAGAAENLGKKKRRVTQGRSSYRTWGLVAKTRLTRWKKSDLSGQYEKGGGHRNEKKKRGGQMGILDVKEEVKRGLQNEAKKDLHLLGKHRAGGGGIKRAGPRIRK